MGIYGHKFDAFGKDIEHQKPEINQGITIEIYVDSDLYNQLLEEKFLIPLQENITARTTLNDGKSIDIVIRDIKSMTMGGDIGHHPTSFKVVKPKSIVGKGVDIITPQFVKDGEAPYKGGKVPGHFKNGDKSYVDPKAANKIKLSKNTYPDEINLALKFGDQFYKQLNLIYMKPDNETNQYKLLKEIISKCDYITSCSVGDPEKDKELSELIEKKKKGNK